jgi:hypothetical protein
MSNEELLKLRNMQNPLIHEAIMNVTERQRKDIMSMSHNLKELNDIIENHQGLSI